MDGLPTAEDLSELLEAIPDGIIIAGLDGLVRTCNATAERMFGWSRDELVDQEVEVLMPPEVRERHRAIRQRYADAPEWRTMRGVGDGIRKDGRRFPMELSLAPMLRDGATVIIAAARDVSSRKQMEAELLEQREQLFQSQKLESIGHLTAGIAHEFNNLLHAVSMHVGFATDSLEPHQQQARSDLEIVRECAERGAALTQALLNFGRRRALQLAPVDPARLVAQHAALVRPLLPSSVQFETECGACPLVLADETQIGQVLLNLTLNARDALGERGRIVVRCHPRGDDVVFEVEDTGPGLPDELKDRVFAPFFTTKEVGHGTGLGLSMASRIVEQHKGQLVVLDAQPTGALFRFVLPSATDVPAAQQRRALVVEDDRQTRVCACLVLHQHGWSADEAPSEQEAMRLLAARDYDVVLVGEHLPGRSGTDVAGALRSAEPGLNIGLVTGAGVDLEGSLPTLSKPFGPDHLIRFVEALLDDSAQAATRD